LLPEKGKGVSHITQLKNIFATRWGIIGVGAFIGILASLLQRWGNPGNMGICVVCFERDIAGAIGFHRAAVFVLGMIVGAGLSHNFGLASSPPGVGPHGIAAVIVGMLVCLFIGFTTRKK
jgi:hypothetical protein